MRSGRLPRRRNSGEVSADHHRVPRRLMNLSLQSLGNHLLAQPPGALQDVPGMPAVGGDTGKLQVGDKVIKLSLAHNGMNVPCPMPQRKGYSTGLRTRHMSKR